MYSFLFNPFLLYLELENLTLIRVAQNFQSDLQSEASEIFHYFQNWHILIYNVAFVGYQMCYFYK